MKRNNKDKNLDLLAEIEKLNDPLEAETLVNQMVDKRTQSKEKYVALPELQTSMAYYYTGLGLPNDCLTWRIGGPNRIFAAWRNGSEIREDIKGFQFAKQETAEDFATALNFGAKHRNNSKKK